MLSARTKWDSSHNPLTEAWDRRRRDGLPCCDLTQSNPTRCGFSYPQELLAGLSSSHALLYTPVARGMPAAIDAVAEHLSNVYGSDRRAASGSCIGGILTVRPGGPESPTQTLSSDRAHTGSRPVDPSAILLCAGTSEAYGWLFKLLCDHGDHILVPRPSYPLLEYLADLEGVRLKPYTLRHDGRWNLDAHALEDALTSRTKAVVVIHPNNPTGSLLNHREASLMREFCVEHRLALISDEVFLEYPLPAGEDSSRLLHSDDADLKACGEADRSSRESIKARLPRLGQSHCAQLDDEEESGVSGMAVDSPCLAFSLGGLSKSCGLPQLKVGWIHVGGPQYLAQEALKRLEIISDTYLSVNTPAQIALPRILRLGRAVGDQIRRRTASNWAWLRSRSVRSSGAPWNLLDTEAGWYAILRIPNTRTEEDWCVDLVKEHGILLHPGYFFDFPHEAFVVASLLPEEDEFREAMDLVLEFVEQSV